MNATLRRIGKPILEIALPPAERLTGFYTAAGDYLPHRLQMLVGAYEAEELRLMRRFISPGHTIIDAGANIGYTVRFFAETTGRTGQVYGFEPNPIVFPILQKNVADYAQVKVFNFGLSSRHDKMHLFLAGNNHSVASFAQKYPGMHLAYRPQDSIHMVCAEVVRGDDFIKGAGLARVDAIKMDVEGWELDVLAGFEETITRSPGIILFCEFSPPAQRCAGHEPRALLDWLWAHNFTICYPRNAELKTVSTNAVEAFIEEIVARDYVTLFADRRKS